MLCVSMRKYAQERLDELIWVIKPKGLLYHRIELDPEENPFPVIIHSDIVLPEVWVDRSNDAERLEKELKRDGDNAPHVIEIQKLGGTGKSCFTRKFFDEVEKRGLKYDRRIWFSFYKLRNTTGIFDQFLNFILEKIDLDYYIKSQGVKGSNRTGKYSERLVDILRNKRILIILDGLEVAQYNDGTFKMETLEKPTR